MGDVLQLQLFRNSDPSTSEKAARLLKPGTQQMILLGVFAQFPSGLTAEEAAEKGGVYQGWKRVSDLLNAGFIVPTGETRMSKAGREQRVLKITPDGLERLR